MALNNWGWYRTEEWMGEMAGSDWDTFIWTELLELCVDNQWTYLGLLRYMGLILLVGTSWMYHLEISLHVQIIQSYKPNVIT